LDDNYFPEKKTQFHFLKIIGFSFLFIISFGLLYMVLLFAFIPYFDEYATQKFPLILYVPFIFSTTPFIYIFHLEYKNGDINNIWG